MATETYNEGDMRIWWHNNHVRNTDHRVNSLKEAGEMLQSFAARDLADNSVVWNTGGLQVLEDGAWVEWYSDDGMDIWEYIDENGIEMPAVKSEPVTAPEITKTREEIEALKDNWSSDPCWNIEDTEGFEAHREELVAFAAEKELEWDAEVKRDLVLRQMRLEQRAAELQCSVALVEYIETLERRLKNHIDRQSDFEDFRSTL